MNRFNGDSCKGYRYPAAVLLTCLSVACGSHSSSAQEEPLDREARIAMNQAVFQKAMALVDEHFFDPALLGDVWAESRNRYSSSAQQAADTDELYAALNRLFSELRVSHLQAFTPQQVNERSSQQVGAVGLRGQEIEGATVVIDVLPDSPAERAGVRPGWIVTELNGMPLPFEDEAIALQPGQPIDYVFVDAQDQVHAITLAPAALSPLRREARLLERDIVYLRFDQFDTRTTRWLSNELEEHEAAPGVILDLRFNSGGGGLATRLALGEFYSGIFRDSIEQAGVWIDRENGRQQFSATSLFSAGYEGRVVILTDQATRSAAEVFARVLQFHGRAIVVGRVSAGAVMAAERYELPDGGSLTVPIRDYRDPAGERLEGRGVQPDVPVNLTLAEIRSGDADLLTALEILMESLP